jgi:murein DD-endopeptidase MepM/ murein hydrolase activator NlpD
LNLRHLRPGDEVEIRYASAGDLEAIWIHRGALETYEVRRERGDWVGDQLVIVIEHREVARHGILEGSLFASMERLGESAALVIAFAEVFAWDFDFYTQSRQGDRFSLLVEKLYRDDAFVGYGDLLAASYRSGQTDLSAFLFVSPDGKKGYYDPQGKSMRKAFLRAPLKFQRISSRFSYARLHPVHRRRMPHLGVDYAAPRGTPVHSVAAGTVTGISTKGGGGRMVTIRHAMGYQSKYLHLSRFAKGLRVGKRVQQKQVIGYVGSTGLATGTHLDFRLIRYGKPVNPLKQIFPPGPPVAEEHMEAYLERVEELATKMEPPAPSQRAAKDASPRGGNDRGPLPKRSEAAGNRGQ